MSVTVLDQEMYTEAEAARLLAVSPSTRLRDRLGVSYPLAHAQAFAHEGKLIIAEAQQAAGLAPEYYLVAPVGGQMLLTPPADAYHERLRYQDDVVSAWRPHDDPNSRVLIRPDVRFGRPAVAGISTDVLWEQVDAGVSIDEVAVDFGISPRDVRWAVGYESARAA